MINNSPSFFFKFRRNSFAIFTILIKILVILIEILIILIKILIHRNSWRVATWKPDWFEIYLEFFKNSTAVCFSEKILTWKLETYQIWNAIVDEVQRGQIATSWLCFNFSGQNFFIWLRNSFIILVAIPRKSSRPKLPLILIKFITHTQIFLKRVCNRKYLPWKLNVICGNIVQIWLMMSSGIPKLHSIFHFLTFPACF